MSGVGWGDGIVARQRVRSTILIVAATQFVVLTVAAMFAYPGGTPFHPDASRYLFFNNFFSDLGATKAYGGASNLASHVLFLLALTIVGLACIAFAPAWRVVAGTRGVLPKTATASQWVLVVSGIGFIGIAVTPWNLVLDAHNAFVRLAFGVLLLYLVCMLTVQLRVHWPRAYVGVNVGYLVLLVTYVVLLFAGPDLTTEHGREVQVAAQKVIVYASIVNLAIQAVGIRRDPPVQAQ
jgi:hypothetical protein